MCDDHSGVLVEIPSASVRGEHGRKRGIDACIAPLVEALNAVGLDTRASCCGHGKRPGNIILDDGREVLIARNFDEGRLVDKVLDSTYGSVLHTNSGSQEIEGIRIEIEERKTYWIDKRPDGWTNQEWAETVAAAERGERDHGGIEALLPMKAHIIEEDFEVDRVVWEKA